MPCYSFVVVVVASLRSLINVGDPDPVPVCDDYPYPYSALAFVACGRLGKVERGGERQNWQDISIFLPICHYTRSTNV